VQRLANALGWFSLVLGAAQILVPDVMNRQVAANATEGNRKVMRGIGAREILTGAGILLMRRRRTRWLWARVAGDAIDLALLGRVLLAKGPKARLVASAGNVAGITALDVLAARRLNSAR
jgi:hypothetical protein